jgi:hypothetical protein
MMASSLGQPTRPEGRPQRTKVCLSSTSMRFPWRGPVVVLGLGLIAAIATVTLLNSAALTSSRENSDVLMTSGGVLSLFNLRSIHKLFVSGDELEGQINCAALFAALDDNCGHWGCWYYRDTNSSCDNDPMMRRPYSSHSKCPLMTAYNMSSSLLLREGGPAAAMVGQSGQGPGQTQSRPLLIYQHIMWMQEVWESELLAVKSPYLITRHGGCMDPELKRRIFVTDLLPLTPQAKGNRTLKAKLLEGMESPRKWRNVCERLRAATAIVGSIRDLNAHGYAFNDWKLSQWGYDASGTVVLIDVGAGNRFADLEDEKLHEVTRKEGIHFGGATHVPPVRKVWTDAISVKVNDMASKMRTAKKAHKLVEGLQDGALWRLYQSTLLLCLVERTTLSDNYTEYSALQSPMDRTTLAAIDTLLGRLRTSLYSDLASPAPTDAVWHGITHLLDGRCGGSARLNATRAASAASPWRTLARWAGTRT